MKTIRSMATGIAASLLILGVSSAHAATTTLLYVSGGLDRPGTVKAYNPAASGVAVPVLTINQPTEAYALAFDSALRLYSMSYLGEALDYVYPPYASGNATPLLSATGMENDANGIAVDSKGYTYRVAGSNAGGTFLSIVPPNATRASSWIQLKSYAYGITVDNEDNVIVATYSRLAPDFNFLPDDISAALEIYAPQLVGGAPIRVITGANTHLFSPGGPDAGFRVSYSKLTGRLYAGISSVSSTESKVFVFDSHANGNVAPLRIISGAATGLGSSVRGVAANPVTGEIFVLSDGNVTVYPQLADGNAVPLRTLTGFGSSTDMAFSPPPSVSINAGGAASSNFIADSNFTGGGAVTWTNAVDTSSLVGTIPPQNVLQSDREGNFSYKLTGFTPNSLHTITAYFVENYFSAPNKRVFTLYANGAPFFVNLDIFAATGAKFIAIQRSLTVNASVKGEILIQAVASKDQAKIGAIVVN